MRQNVLGQFHQRACPVFLAALAFLAAVPGIAADKPAEKPALTVSQMQAGGFVYDKGNRLVTDPRLKISFIPMFETFRSQAPLNVRVRVQWNGNGLLEGRVLCDIYAFERYIGSWKSDEIAVNTEVLEFPLTLPPSPLYNERDLFNLRIAFEAEDRTILMDPRDLPVESHWARNYVVGVVAPDNVTRISGFRSEKQAPQVADLFQLSNFHNDPVHATQLVTNTAPIVTRELPLDPMRFTAFDLIVLSPESLRELRPAQWKALATWIRAGGRACLLATMAVPENLRPAWRELFNEQPDSPQMTFSDKGIPEFTDGGTKLRLRAGCGRVLCLTEAAEVDSPEWTDDVLWLFAVRAAPRKSILTTGKWSIGPVVEDDRLRQTLHPLAPAKRPITELRGPLNSPEIGKVSPVTILLLLGTCLMLIGPVDYYVLGRLGMRKLTWIFLPAVALATTWATMRVSQSALGGKDYARAISVADLDSNGRVCRVSRLEQRYAGRQSVDQRTLNSTFRIDFERPLLGWNSSFNPLVPWQGDMPAAQPPVRYVGKVTGAYDVLEPMFQWSPRIFRETTFGDDPRIDAKRIQSVNWSQLDQIPWTRSGPHKAQLLTLVRDALPEAVVFLHYVGKTEKLGSREPPAPTDNTEGFAIPASPPPATNENPEMLARIVANATSSPLTYVESANEYSRPVIRPHGLFGLVSERSPTCGADLEDFQWIDEQDPREAVLLILIPGEDSVLYRRRLTLKSRI